jgi:hypothetical protein
VAVKSANTSKTAKTKSISIEGHCDTKSSLVTGGGKGGGKAAKKRRTNWRGRQKKIKILAVILGFLHRASREILEWRRDPLLRSRGMHGKRSLAFVYILHCPMLGYMYALTRNTCYN